jgi:hypothetical protein
MVAYQQVIGHTLTWSVAGMLIALTIWAVMWCIFVLLGIPRYNNEKFAAFVILMFILGGISYIIYTYALFAIQVVIIIALGLFWGFIFISMLD